MERFFSALSLTVMLWGVSAMAHEQPSEPPTNPLTNDRLVQVADFGFSQWRELCKPPAQTARDWPESSASNQN